MKPESLLNPSGGEGGNEGQDDAAAEAARAAAAAAAGGGEGSSDGGGGGDNGAAERPDFIPADAWGENGYDETKHLETLRAKFRPADADAYELPDIEGFDKEKAAGSPIMGALRKSAFDAGLDQAGFAKVIGDYVAGEKAAGEARVGEELKKLGDNANARITALNNWLGSALPKDQANAVAAMATTAEAVKGLEALMGKSARAAPGGGGGGTARKTKAQIEELMSTPAYRGTQAERKPEVIAEVDKWFQEEAAVTKK